MLSYRHAFHAGNFADVLKHVVLTEILAYLVKKDLPFDYIDTHAGAGLYDLRTEHATKAPEHAAGVGRLRAADWPELADYFAAIQRYNPKGEQHYYPGSPFIAMHFLRDKDRAWLFELHPADHEALKKNTAADRRVRVMREDGFQGLLGLLPPVSRRGLILLDPPYEIKTDYRKVFDTVSQAYKKFATGIYAIWYPVVERKVIEQLLNNFEKSGIKKISWFELGVAARSSAKGMQASGMIVINPPWTLFDTMSTLLPRLTKALAQDQGAFYRCEVLVGEA